MSRADDLDRRVTELYLAERGMLGGFLRGLGCPDSLVEDVVQDSFLALRLRMEKPGIESLEAYLYTIARHRYYRLTHTQAFQGLPSSAGQAAGGYDNIDRRLALRAAVSRLPAREAEVLLLRCACDLSVEATARVLNVAEGTVKRALHDGRARLSGLLSADYDTWGEELG